MKNKRRVLVLVDGYNLYHGLCDMQGDIPGDRNHAEWLDLKKLMLGFMNDTHHELVDVIYFTAYAKWRKKEFSRHRVYVRALVHSGVKTVFGRFKEKPKKCKKCGSKFLKHEEKETDVNIAVEMFDAAHRDVFDDIYIVSADTDLAGAIKRLKQDFKDKRVKVFMPPNRSNLEMRKVGHRYKVIKEHHILNALFPKIVKPAFGKGPAIVRPTEYDPPDDDTLTE